MTKTIVQKMAEAMRQPVPYEGLLGRESSFYGKELPSRSEDMDTPDNDESALWRHISDLRLGGGQKD